MNTRLWVVPTIALICTVVLATVFGSAMVVPRETFANAEKSSAKYLILISQWGMANRLRCMSVGHELATKSNRRLVMINEDDVYKPFFGGDWADVIVAPVGMETSSFMKDKDIVRIGEENEDCGVKVSLSDIRSRDDRYIAIESCEIEVTDMTVENTLYKIMKPTQRIADRLEPILSKIRKGNVVGVHIRQGNVPDYKQQYFFGDWDTKDEPLPIFCCFDDANKNMTSCPPNVQGLERFINAMKEEPDDVSFFVCSDRPGCLLSLEVVFPHRILHNGMSVEHDVNFEHGFCDWWCLAHCKKMLLTGPSSFSVEATKVNGAEAKYIV
jgi:hypothetical protein